MWLFQLVWVPTSGALNILSEAIKYPYVHYSFRDILGLQPVYMALAGAIPRFAVAWILSLWVFGAGPFEALISYHVRSRRKHG